MGSRGNSFARPRRRCLLDFDFATDFSDRRRDLVGFFLRGALEKRIFGALEFFFMPVDRAGSARWVGRRVWSAGSRGRKL
ncbi:MAG: hypothetical protein EDM74_08730 [Armatimonadetes bacterium]|nr:MAG: hypothetical protein EDM74_08730 [Armatimonadota bacterium]